MRDIRITNLDNGVRIATDHMPTVESVSMGIWVRAGARYERPEINGVAHLLEHMVFKGTKRRSARLIAEEIEAVGGSINAYTSRETTAYFAKVLNADVPLAVDVLADIFQHSVIDEGELARERAVVLQEIGQSNDTPDDIVFDHFQAMAYPDQPIGRPVLGPADIVRDMPRDALVGFHGEHYSAGRTVVAAAGKVDHDALVDLASEALDGMSTGAAAAPPPASYEGGEFREDRDLEQIHLVLGFRGAAIAQPDYYALSVLSNLFGGGMSSRLFQEIREERGLVYSIDSFLSAFADTGLFGIYAGTGDAEIEELIPVLCDQIARLADDLTEEEVMRARTQLKASLLMALESTAARCEQMAQHLLLLDRIMPMEELVSRIDAIDRASVAGLARQVFASPPTLAAVGPLSRLEPLDAMSRRIAA